MLTKRDILTKAQSRYTGTFKEDEVFDLVIRSSINHLSQLQDDLYSMVDKLFNIDKSSGLLLDLIGKLINQPRVLVSYDVERKFGFFGHPLSESFGTVDDPDVGGYWKSASEQSSKFKIMDDETYRTVLRARIKSNTSGGTINDFLEVVNTLTGTQNARIDINSSGDALLVVPDENLELLQYFFTRIGTEDSILPIPLGVNLRVELI